MSRPFSAGTFDGNYRSKCVLQRPVDYVNFLKVILVVKSLILKILSPYYDENALGSVKDSLR